MSFGARRVDILPLLQARRFAEWSVDETHGRLVYLSAPAPSDAGSRRDSVRVYIAPLQPGRPIDPTTGRQLASLDWSREVVSRMVMAPDGREMLLVRGTPGKWSAQLYGISVATGAVRRVIADGATDVAVTPDGRRAVYLSPIADSSDSQCLRVFDIERARVLSTTCETTSGHRLAQSLVLVSPDSREAAVRVIDEHGLRNNAIIVDLSGSSPPRLLLKVDSTARSISLNSWPATTELRFWRDGPQGSTLQATNPQEGVPTAARALPGLRLTVGGRHVAVDVTTNRDIVGSTLRIRDAASGEEIGSWFSSDPFTIHPWGVDGARGNRVLGTFASPLVPLRGDELSIAIEDGRTIVSTRAVLRPSAEVTRLTDQCRVTRVDFPTWDRDPRSGAMRQLPAFLYEPIVQPAPAERTAVILAYYGGSQSYPTISSTYGLLHCALGITFFSPAIRDVRGPQEAMSEIATIDPMVGEVRDLVYAARFLEQHVGIASERIGLFGGSHGGGTVLRAMTALRAGVGFPATERYTFAFGVAQSPGDKRGVLDPTHRHFRRDSTFFANVMGDTSALMARLPFARMDLLQQPVLVWQGTEDPTVPIADTRRHVQAARDIGRPIELIELAGEGHNFGMLSSFIETFRAQLSFMQRALSDSR